MLIHKRIFGEIASKILFLIYMMYEFSVHLKKPYSQLHDYLKFFSQI